MTIVEITLPPGIEADALRPMVAPARTALLVIDAQVDFIAPDGPAARAGVDMSAAHRALDKVTALIDAARRAGVTAVFIRVVTREETDSRALRLFHARRSGGNVASPAICRAGTPGADYYGVRPAPGEIEIEKTLYSSFAGTPLDAELRSRGIETLVVCGFTTECCVDSTVRDAFHRNYNLFVVTDACAAYDPAMHLAALRALSENCALLAETSAVIAAWRP